MNNLEINLQGRVVLISGANRGIGLAIAIELLERGAKKVYAGTRNLEAFASVESTFEGRLIPIQLDVTDESSIEKAANKASDVDILINNAGVLQGDSLLTRDALNNFKTHFDVNVLGLLKLTQAFLPQIRKSDKGAIVSISSLAGLGNMPMIGSYSVSKAAVHSIIQGLRAELQADKVLVIGVYPGPIETDMTKGFEMDMDAPQTVASNIANALETGLEDVFPDKMSMEISAIYQSSPKTIETEFGKFKGSAE